MAILPQNEHPIIRDVVDFLAMSANDTQLREIERAQAGIEVRRDDEQVLLRDWTPATSVGWGVWVDGWRHGGRHQLFADALEHAAHCSQWTAEMRLDWRELRESLAAIVEKAA